VESANLIMVGLAELLIQAADCVSQALVELLAGRIRCR